MWIWQIYKSQLSAACLASMQTYNPEHLALTVYTIQNFVSDYTASKLIDSNPTILYLPFRFSTTGFSLNFSLYSLFYRFYSTIRKALVNIIK